MAEFFSSRLLRWLIAPYRSRLVTAASKPFYTVADRILGAQFLQDIADFFILFQTMYGGFVERARAVTRTLEDRRTAFMVVSTLDPVPVREAEFFVAALAERGYHLGAVVLNRVLPGYLREPAGLVAADAMTARADELAAELARAAEDRAALAGVLREVAESFRNYRLVATREAEQLGELTMDRDLLVTVPALEHDVASLGDVLTLGRELW
jgi:anion-transporting  ArsA/GET3 family ATPase